MSRFRPRNQSYWLAQLCESNFLKLTELVPDLASLNDRAVAGAQGKPPLHLQVIERSPYTLTLELKHCFEFDDHRVPEPGLCVRVYLDGKCAEVLSSRRQWSSRHARNNGQGLSEILEEKWCSNYFLQRWLEHCLRRRYRFALVSSLAEPSALA
jgi:uncharacterized protein YqiB (DUF1249 family)